MKTKLEEFAEKILELEIEMKASGETAFKEYFSSLFEEYKWLDGIKWDQYTPYWNDGEPCVFGIRQPSLSINDKIDCEMESDYEDEWYYDWNLKGHDYNSVTRKYIDTWIHPGYELVLKIDSILDINKKLCLFAFGDHSEITVYRDKILVEECNHD